MRKNRIIVFFSSPKGAAAHLSELGSCKNNFLLFALTRPQRGGGGEEEETFFRWKIDSVLRLTCDSFMIVTSALVVTSIHVSRLAFDLGGSEKCFKLRIFFFGYAFWNWFILFSFLMEIEIHDRNWPVSAVKFPAIKRFRLCANWTYNKGMCRRYWVGRKER